MVTEYTYTKNVPAVNKLPQQKSSVSQTGT